MAETKDTGITLHRKRLAKLALDTRKSAKAVSLVYVSDSEAGIVRNKEGEEFTYYRNKKRVTGEAILQRIRALVLPPAWERVWICDNPDGHLQATGYDAKGRKQYKYHPLWVTMRNQAKFSHMYEFGQALPAIREAVEKGLRQKELNLQKVLAAIVAVMQHTSVRIGNSSYEKENGSYGLTTLKDKHVVTKNGKMQFVFVGKKGVRQCATLDNRKLARIVQQCKDIPGKELFQYYDEDGRHYPVDSGMVNSYIKEISGHPFTAKDFRTWFGSLKALQHLKNTGWCDTEKGRKEKIIEAIDAVAAYLGNTRAVCRKYYIHPGILDCYNDKKLADLLCGDRSSNGADGLSPDEKALMKILEMQAKVVVG